MVVNALRIQSAATTFMIVSVSVYYVCTAHFWSVSARRRTTLTCDDKKKNMCELWAYASWCRVFASPVRHLLQDTLSLHQPMVVMVSTIHIHTQTTHTHIQIHFEEYILSVSKNINCVISRTNTTMLFYQTFFRSTHSTLHTIYIIIYKSNMYSADIPIKILIVTHTMYTYMC